ncbi:hypothetical protein [Arthrobacter sp. C152]
MDAATQPTAPATAEPADLAALQPAEPAAVPAPPSIHVRAVITWLAIFPLVAVGMMAAAPLMESWHPIFRAMALTMVVVPTAVYVVLPRLFAAHGFLVGRRSTRR